MLAYLALEGEASRARLTQLLWPHRPARTARNNLRKQLSRLQKGYPEPCVVGLDPVKLADELCVDVLLLRSAYDRQDYGSAIRFTGDLLADLQLEAALEDGAGAGAEPREELLAWLLHARLKIRRMQFHAHEREIERLEQERRLPEALDLARRFCSLEEAPEEAWRTVMELHCKMGERSAALAAYRECQETLRTRFNVEPSRETRALYREIERQDISARFPASPRRPQVPPSVRHPPLLVGREREWAEMEAAWEARKPMFVFGAPGVGKSRLMTEFARSRGNWIRLEARPGDHGTSYATHVRNGQKLLEQRRKDGRPPIPQWITEQLAPLIPEIGEPGDPGARRSGPEDKVRSLNAAVELFCDTCRDMDVVVFDDGQYIDPDSFELGIYIHHQLAVRSAEARPGERPYPLIINGYRENQVDPGFLDLIREMVSQGLAAWIDVKPLTEPDVKALLRSMEVVPDLEARANEFARYTGGNPLYVVETVMHLVGSGLPRDASPFVLPLADPVRKLIRTRLRTLSPAAREIARVVAVARTNTSQEAVAAVLQLPLQSLVEPYRELQEQGVLAQEWFTHDVLGEVLLEEIPEQTRDYLRRRLAELPRR